MKAFSLLMSPASEIPLFVADNPRFPDDSGVGEPVQTVADGGREAIHDGAFLGRLKPMLGAWS